MPAAPVPISSASALRASTSGSSTDMPGAVAPVLVLDATEAALLDRDVGPAGGCCACCITGLALALTGVGLCAAGVMAAGDAPGGGENAGEVADM